MQTAEASAADRGDEDDVFTEPVSPAQQLVAREKATVAQIKSWKTYVERIPNTDHTQNAG